MLLKMHSFFQAPAIQGFEKLFFFVKNEVHVFFKDSLSIFAHRFMYFYTHHLTLAVLNIAFVNKFYNFLLKIQFMKSNYLKI